MMIRMVSGWVFLLVPAHPGSPRQRAVKWLLCVVVCYCTYCHFAVNGEIAVLIMYCNVGECMKHLALSACFNKPVVDIMTSLLMLPLVNHWVYAPLTMRHVAIIGKHDVIDKKYITYCIVRRGPSRGHRYMYWKFCEVWTCCFWDMQVDRQTYRHANCNSLHPYWGWSNYLLYRHMAFIQMHCHNHVCLVYQ